MTGSWTWSFCSSIQIQIHGLFGYLLLQFWSNSFNILYDVYTHNGGVHVHRILMVRWGHHLCLTDTLHFLKITPNKTTLSIIIKCEGILLFQFIPLIGLFHHFIVPVPNQDLNFHRHTCIYISWSLFFSIICDRWLFVDHHCLNFFFIILFL